MSNISQGMDVAAVEALGRRLQKVASDLDGWAALLERGVLSSNWNGPDAQAFKTGWWPRHKTELQKVARDLHGFGQSALNNAQEQLRASDAEFATVGSGAAYQIASESWEREARFGAVGENVETGAVEVIQMSDGTWRVRAKGGTAYQLSGGDLIGIGSLIPGARALALLEGVGVDARMMGRGYELEYSLADEASARRLAGAIERQFSGLDTLDGLSEREVVSEAVGEYNRGTDIGAIAGSRTREGLDIGGSVDIGGLEADYHSSGLSHGFNSEDHAMVDTLTRSGIVRGDLGPVEMATAEEVSVLRSATGEVVGITVRNTTSAAGEVDLSSSSIRSALHIKDAGTGFEGGIAEGVVSQRTTTYDLTDPRFSDVAMSLGCTDPNAAMSASDIDDVLRRAESSGASSSTTTEVYRSHETSSSAGLLWSADFDNKQRSMELIYRS